MQTRRKPWVLIKKKKKKKKELFVRTTKNKKFGYIVLFHGRNSCVLNNVFSMQRLENSFLSGGNPFLIFFYNLPLKKSEILLLVSAYSPISSHLKVFILS
jgi:hypothetical protein